MFCLITCIILLSACQSNENEAEASLLRINGNLYTGHETVNAEEFLTQKWLGEVKKEVRGIPTEDYSSNYLKVGSKIFSIDDSDQTILVKHRDGRWQIYRTLRKE